MPKLLYHGELRAMGPVKVTVASEPVQSPKQAHKFTIALRIGDDLRHYSPENQACCDFWVGKNGQTFTVIAEGQRAEATITDVGRSVAKDKPVEKSFAQDPNRKTKPAEDLPPLEVKLEKAPAFGEQVTTAPTNSKPGMRITELRYDRVINTGNYCNEKIGVTLQIEEGTKAADVLAAARKFCDAHQAKEAPSVTGGRV